MIQCFLFQATNNIDRNPFRFATDAYIAPKLTSVKKLQPYKIFIYKQWVKPQVIT